MVTSANNFGLALTFSLFPVLYFSSVYDSSFDGGTDFTSFQRFPPFLSQLPIIHVLICSFYICKTLTHVLLIFSTKWMRSKPISVGIP